MNWKRWFCRIFGHAFECKMVERADGWVRTLRCARCGTRENWFHPARGQGSGRAGNDEMEDWT